MTFPLNEKERGSLQRGVEGRVIEGGLNGIFTKDNHRDLPNTSVWFRKNPSSTYGDGQGGKSERKKRKVSEVPNYAE